MRQIVRDEDILRIAQRRQYNLHQHGARRELRSEGLESIARKRRFQHRRREEERALHRRGPEYIGVGARDT